MKELFSGLMLVVVCLVILAILGVFVWFWLAGRRRNKMWREYCEGRDKWSAGQRDLQKPVSPPAPSHTGGYGTQRAFEEGNVQHRPRPTVGPRPQTPPPSPRPMGRTSYDNNHQHHVHQSNDGLTTGVALGVGLGLMATALSDSDDQRRCDPQPDYGSCDRDDSPADSGGYDGGSSDNGSWD